MKNSEESAFPFVDETGKAQSIAAGLTKREYFAAMAMQGVLANPNYNGDYKHLSVVSVKVADALLAELEK